MKVILKIVKLGVGFVDNTKVIEKISLLNAKYLNPKKTFSSVPDKLEN